MRRRNDGEDVQALRDEFALAGTPLAGDEDIAALFGALRESRDGAAPVPSAQLTTLLERGFDPAPAAAPRPRPFRAGRLAATGLTLKALVGATVLGAGVATASVVVSIPGEELITETVDAIVPDGGGGQDESSTPPDTVRTDEAGLIATTGMMPPPVLPAQTGTTTEATAESSAGTPAAEPGAEPAVPAAPTGPGHVPGVPQGGGSGNGNPTPGVPNSGGNGNNGNGSSNNGNGNGNGNQGNGNRPDVPPGQGNRPDIPPGLAKKDNP